MSDSTYEQFFSDFGAFLSKEKWRKKLNNDYNPLLVIRSQSDEVRLHSRIIHSLLDTRGNHYVGTLFLEPFLATLKLKDFAMDLDKAVVMAEYKHIDLYISDNDKHIIIENKIYADDGDKQIERYIDTLINDGVDCENIAVVYLSVNRREIADYSLGAWRISDDKKYLMRDNDKIIYKNITYENEILSWVESCQSIAKNIANLNATLEFYKDCVTKITKGDKMALKEFLESHKDNTNYAKIVAEIQKVKLEDMIFETFARDNEPKITDWQFLDKAKGEITEFKVGGYTRPFAFGNKAHLNQTFKFMLTLEQTRFGNAYIGFSLFIKGEYGGKSYNNFCGFKDKNIPKSLKIIVEKHGFKLTDSGWWLIDEVNGRYDLDLQNETIDSYFKRMCENVDKLNDFLQKDKEIQSLAEQVKICDENLK